MRVGVHAYICGLVGAWVRAGVRACYVCLWVACVHVREGVLEIWEEDRERVVGRGA
jgi:hypothetical protein